MTFQKLEDALITVTENSYRTTVPEGIDFPYIVWNDDGCSTIFSGDGKIVRIVIQGTIDLFTKTVDDPIFCQIQTALNNSGIGFYYNSKQYEEKTEIYHYEWIFEIPEEV